MPRSHSITMLRHRLQTDLIDPLIANDDAVADELIHELAFRDRAVSDDQDDLHARTLSVDQQLAFDWDRHCGTLMTTWGNAGFTVGVALGLELAALVNRDASVERLVRNGGSKRSSTARRPSRTF